MVKENLLIDVFKKKENVMEIFDVYVERLLLEILLEKDYIER